jgi:hypothetical protein
VLQSRMYFAVWGGDSMFSAGARPMRLRCTSFWRVVLPWIFISNAKLISGN